MDRSTISHYRILDKLGEGGMGVVYKAHDTKLDRFVALKFLPPDVSEHGPERARFLQEARAVSAINHPNVCVIYDIDEQSEPPFIAMEYVEGVTLRQAIAEAKEPLPLEVVLRYATQMADALEQAHAAGVVHRDIKSENVMVTPRGRVKVMDFGLAKLRGAAKLTRTATTVGTLSYMAPEQVGGKAVDARADLFSFGVVLYEMLAGRLPFTGPGEAAVMYAIVHTVPEPIAKYRPGLSSEWLHVMDRALEKDPEDRYQSAHDLLIDLRRLKRDTGKVARGALPPPGTLAESATEPEGSNVEPAARTAVAPRARRGQLMWLGGGLVSAGLLFWLWTQLAAKAPPRINPNLSIRSLGLPQTQVGFPGLSPDGNWVAFPAQGPDGTWDLYFLNVHGGEPRRITNDRAGEIHGMDISPDGSEIAYDAGDGRVYSEIRRVPALGGASVLLAEGGLYPRWRPDGKRIGYISSPPLLSNRSGQDEFWTVAADGTDPRREFSDGPEAMHNWWAFDWSPDGRRVAWVRGLLEGRRSGVIVHDLTTGRERWIVSPNEVVWDVAWTRPDEILFASTRGGSVNLWATKATGGAAAQLTKGSGPDIGISASADGRKLLYLLRRERFNLWVSPLLMGAPERVTSEDVPFLKPTVSPDGRQIASFAWPDDPTAKESIQILSRDGATLRQIPGRTRMRFTPEWSPDGRWICYSARRPDSAFVVDVEGGGEPRFVCLGSEPWWRDSEHLVVSFQQRSWLVPLATGVPEALSPESTFAQAFLGPGQVCFRDDHVRKAGEWVGNLGPAGLIGSAKRVCPNIWRLIAPHKGFLVALRRPGELSKILLPSGREVPIPGRFTGLNDASEATVSADGSTIVWTEEAARSELVIVENVH